MLSSFGKFSELSRLNGISIRVQQIQQAQHLQGTKLAGVHTIVLHQLRRCHETHLADAARVRFLHRVTQFVLRQAEFALESLTLSMKTTFGPSAWRGVF